MILDLIFPKEPLSNGKFKIEMSYPSDRFSPENAEEKFTQTVLAFSEAGLIKKLNWARQWVENGRYCFQCDAD